MRSSLGGLLTPRSPADLLVTDCRNEGSFMKNYSMGLCLLLVSGCAMSPAGYRSGEPYQKIEIRGEPKALARCVQESLAGSGWQGVQVARDPQTDLYTVTTGDAMSGVRSAIAFDPIGSGKVAVSTRGVAYLFGPIPPWSQEAIDAAKGCENAR